MRKIRISITILTLILMLCACSGNTTSSTAVPATTTHFETLAPASTTASTQSITTRTQAKSTVTTTTTAKTATNTSTPKPTQTNAHSPLYIPDISVDTVIQWFNEVVLDAEIINSGDAGLVQKWTSPIHYRIVGEATAHDRQALQEFATQLNNISGFPGMYETTEAEHSNLTIFFCQQSEFTTHMGAGFEDMDGAVTFWYNGANQIYNATICYRTDIDQYVRNSVLLEEIYNGLGPMQDTWLRSDSIIYADYSTPQALTEIDWLILRLLYHPDILCGMTIAQCEQVIRSLYY